MSYSTSRLTVPCRRDGSRNSQQHMKLTAATFFKIHMCHGRPYPGTRCPLDGWMDGCICGHVCTPMSSEFLLQRVRHGGPKWPAATPSGPAEGKPAAAGRRQQGPSSTKEKRRGYGLPGYRVVSAAAAVVRLSVAKAMAPQPLAVAGGAPRWRQVLRRGARGSRRCLRRG